jgi:hypothetical protein
MIDNAANLGRFRRAVRDDRTVCATAPVPSTGLRDRTSP